jgi:hypothetical protein
MSKGKIENLIPVRSKEEARMRGSAGGKKSGEARREKKLMSTIYGEFLAERFSVTIDGGKKEISGSELVNSVVKKIIVAGGPAAVSLMKEIREATEGSRASLSIENPVAIYIPDNKRGDGPKADKK